VSARFESAAFELPARRKTGLYFAGRYNLRGRTPKADVDVRFNGNIAVSQVKLGWDIESSQLSALHAAEKS
jgi:hypothetical protein